MNQQKVILRHLKSRVRGITSLQAFRTYSITRLADVVFRLRGKGFKIGTEMIKHNGTRYARYFIV